MKRILWFSPIPPSRTDIANYSARLAPHLKLHAELLFCYPDDSSQSGEWPAKPISQLSAAEANAADLCVYHLGNNAEFHSQIWEWAVQHPGLVVLHDRVMHEFFLGHLGFWSGTADQASVRQYLETMAYWYGESGYKAAMEVYSGRKKPTDYAEVYPLYEMALGNALGVLSHNRAVVEEIRERFPLLPVLDLPLPYPLPDHNVVSSRPLRLNDDIRLIAFGFIGRNRRLVEFLQIWAESPVRDRFTLDVAGEMFEVERFQQAVQELGLGNRIKQHGFVSDSRLDQLLSQSHLALNLRYPTMGEASGSQLRIWANHLASVITDIGWYGQLPESTVLKIRHDHEQEDLLALLDGVAHGRINLAAVAEAGWRRLAAHAPDRYVAELVDWFDQERGQLLRLWSARQQIESIAKQEAALFNGAVPLPLPAALYQL